MLRIALILIFSSALSFAQHPVVQGVARNQSGTPLPGASVFAKGTYHGATADSLGRFLFAAPGSRDSLTLVARYLGHAPFQEKIALDQETVRVSVTLVDTQATANTVVITAGAFEASDKKKGVVLRPLDIVTTAGAMGDIATALTTLPGTQAVGEEGQLFVRGGTAGETRTFIDGLRAPFFYTSQVPDLPARGRFSPFLFKGTLFTTGGYSAEYGQALSSALILETEDLPDQSVTSVSLMSVGLGLSHTQRWEKSSLTFSADHTNLLPYFKLVPQRFEFGKPPQGASGALAFRQQLGKANIIKGYFAASRSDIEIGYPALGSQDPRRVKLRNDNVFGQATGRWLAGKWLIRGGLGFSANSDEIELTDARVERRGQEGQAKFTAMRALNKRTTLRTGVSMVQLEREEYFTPKGSEQAQGGSLTEKLGVWFGEVDWKVGKKWALRTGLRAEYSTFLGKANLAPRLSLAYQTGKHSQVSGAYGIFFQNPPHEQLWANPDVRYEQARHLMLNYQWSKDQRTLRVEGYYKWYHQLMRFDPADPYNPATIRSDGDGYARGVDIFWRDRKTFKYADYWVSYSFLDTERKYRDFPETATPHFASSHNFSVVAKRFIPEISTQVGFTYRYASPRPYHDPNTPGFLQERTPAFHNLSFNASYLTSLFSHYTIVYAAISNVTGAQQIFGYRYADTPGPDGQFARRAIQPGAPRFFFVGVFISID